MIHKTTYYRIKNIKASKKQEIEEENVDHGRDPHLFLVALTAMLIDQSLS